MARKCRNSLVEWLRPAERIQDMARRRGRRACKENQCKAGGIKCTKKKESEKLNYTNTPGSRFPVAVS